ncbi:cold shock domain-containing protein [Funiculus sociatus GB2-A5]|jgi:cold shock CspA family protein|uniref:Cold shock domain-containing protein n=1 Tax=Funiculus sociatus GB2-A5 TaxID=2933946 RepID=A0ABV0JR60_9CYAN|nr:MULTISPECIES: cold shock domain-containing protein [unclassified Trichocoleus]MBD1908229.1 cold shock domain-containing protein [Trichocoleus sp. FACHB-832]MBD2006287.1 cold shock domain-containing protein [Trichocoleus sp. FACHB-40]MBD2061761.1 cold shock domain-containing protein [Trichocoleus sp. FACHB-6]
MKPVLRKGQLKTWKDDRGFGFIQPSDGSKEVFLHISALKEASRRPKVGDTVLYDLTTEANGKVRASNASIEGVAPRPLPYKQKPTKHGLEKVIRIAVVGVIAIVAMKFSGSRSPEYSGSRSSSPMTSVTSITKPGCNIKGNISIGTGNKIYHLPGAEDYESTRIDPASGERWFCTESEAIANGWRKSPR